MTTILGLLAVLVVLFVAAVVATREGPVLAEAVPDAADIGLPVDTMSAEDVAGLRFAMAPRGYRMSEVDETLDRIAAELADRDRRIALLEATIEGGEEPKTQDVREADADDLPLPAADPLPAAEPVPAAEQPPSP